MMILYAEVKPGHAFLDPGNWFFDEGQRAQCASAWQDGGGWRLSIAFEMRNKPLSEKTLSFKSLSDAKTFVSEYFEEPVADVGPDGFPSPDDL
jgi:hypothetical protein